jgi:drug/metabolite transporter (DMT)-like permease
VAAIAETNRRGTLLSNKADHTGKTLIGLGLTLAAHSLLGLYVVLARYVFRSFPPFVLMAATFGLGLLVMWPLLSRGLVWADFLKPALWLLAVVTVVRSITKMIAVQYTLAAYVQVIDLSAPVFTSILARLFLREKMPPRTIVTLLATSLGAYLVITADPLHASLPNGTSDLIGILLSVASSLSMAILVVLTAYLARGPSNPANIYVQQTLCLTVTYIVLSITGGESWLVAAKLVPGQWPMLLVFAVVLTAGGWLNIVAIAKSNATLFSVLLSWRLVVVVGFGWLLLGERLDSAYQIAGAVLVAVAISSYLLHQKRPLPVT